MAAGSRSRQGAPGAPSPRRLAIPLKHGGHRRLRRARRPLVAIPLTKDAERDQREAEATVDDRANSSSGRLVAVLHSRPTGRGAITRARVEGICFTLGCDSFEIVNLYAGELPTSGSLDTAMPSQAWAEGRREIELALRGDPEMVLLGYGVRPPVGLQRTYYREQLHWLTQLLISSGHAPWTYGDRPSHPSRWQRIAHRHRPGSSVYDLAPELLRQHAVGSFSLGAGQVAIHPSGGESVGGSSTGLHSLPS